ncbi:MAG TPA: hypothetical protein VNW46_13190 [Gemmatimonadaceae bacterium]|nr:hypothetical protein [Gemmatimonadaceae bacterium]
MTRPHEDLERHSPTDHRPGGAPIQFPPGAWCAIDIVNVRADRMNAGISTYETLIEKARTSSTRARAGAVLRSVNHRHVIAILEIEGHEAFRHLQSAWDDHHLNADRHAVAESSTLGFYRLTTCAGAAALDPATKDAYAFEHVARGPERARPLITAIAAAEGFRGALVFGADDESASAIIYRFTRATAFDTFRWSAAARQVLGPVGASGEAAVPAHPVRTFG